ncbi:MAG: energy transducer TonB [candidate division Zixibacteria bacterium]|nr:energy transducer TonB [candidate division Zixibacteria bacterium]
MANIFSSSLYSPYGAYELKAKYQRNFFMGTLATLTFVVLILVISWVITNLGKEEVIDAPVVVIKTIAELGPPPTIAKKPPQVAVSQPNVVAPKVGIPKPVADDEVIDDDVVLATRDELAQIVAPDVRDITDMSGDDIKIEIEDDYLPDVKEFTPVEIYPEMIYEEKPDYPRLAEQAGIEGIVYVRALVSKEGKVLDAVVEKSSGTASLDDAAVKAAFKNRFKPGIQNGRPIACWVTYRVAFELNQ